MTNEMKPSRDITRLIEIMAALRTPKTGCPWDLEQTFKTIAPYTIEEAYEVADAIERNDTADLKDELGDLLLQVVYHARMAEEQDAFSFADVVEGISNKMIRRHPHVFGDEIAKNAGGVKGLWDKIKAEEKAEKAAEKERLTPSPHALPSHGERVGVRGGTETSVRGGNEFEQAAAPHPNPLPAEERGEGILADVPLALPALSRAIKLQDKAAKVGFDWPGLIPVFDKVKEELAEFEEVAFSAAPSDSPSSSRLGTYAETPSPSMGEGRGGAQAARSEYTPLPNPPPQGGRENPDATAQLKTGAVEDKRNAAIKEEFGDLLFVLANVARHLKIDPEACLRGANQKFIRRFGHIETRLTERGSSPAQSSLEEMDALWDEAKFLENYDAAPAPDEGDDA